jgi:hypothetical protein
MGHSGGIGRQRCDLGCGGPEIGKKQITQIGRHLFQSRQRPIKSLVMLPVGADQLLIRIDGQDESLQQRAHQNEDQKNGD